MTDVLDPPAPPDRIIEEPLEEALSRRYLAYALSTITNRALPDVRDGLKPVHRRLLHAMRQLRLAPGEQPKKSARVVGDVIGKFHPHGDVAVYDALVRLAQDFAQRYPLIEGQGNFGNIDGDNPAAMRYTECRLTPAAELLLDGIVEDAVDFRPTYDDQDEEPVVLPGGFPNLLANGATGIAVGMATSIPPHNAHELIDAALALIADPNLTTQQLCEHVQGPDFPTGGMIVESKAALLEAYETGRGGVRVRATWSREAYGKGQYRIVVTEIPYQVQKGRLLEQLAALIDAKKLPLVADIRDESAEDVRLVIEPRTRDVDEATLMESLFRQSDLETRFPVNMNVLDARGTPRVMGLKAMLRAFLDHRREVLQRRSRHRLEAIERRLHVLDALLIVFLNLDEVIRIVRFEDEPKARLIETFTLTDTQAEAILNTRLRALAKLEEMELRREHEALTEERDGILALLGSERQQWKLVAVGLRGTLKILGRDTALGRRRSVFGEAPDAADLAPVSAFVSREPITVVLSEKGWIRAVKGRVDDPRELKFKEGDNLAFAIPAETTDKILIFASDGRFFTLAGDKLPPGRGHGEPLKLMIDLDDSVRVLSVFAHKSGGRRLVASKAGYGFIVPEDAAVAMKRGGKQVLNLDEGGQALLCSEIAGDQVATLGANHKALIFPVEELPEMGRGKGVKLQAYRDGGLADAVVFAEESGPTFLTSGGQRREWKDWRDWRGRRASAGRMAPKGMRRLT